jgi:hypothetical protein
MNITKYTWDGIISSKGKTVGEKQACLQAATR